MSRFLKILAVMCLLLMATTLPSSSTFAQTYEDLAAEDAVQSVKALVDRLNAATADVRRHRFTPPYYDEPCSPTKSDAEATLAPYRIQRREFAAEIAALKTRILQLEKFSSSAVVLANKGWKVHDQGRFKTLDSAFRAFQGAILNKETELDKIPVQPCPRTQPTTPVTPVTPAADTPLTPAEEAQFEDFPLAAPLFDDPVTMPTPPKFCTFAERRAWMDSVYWPTVKRAEANALKAIEAFGKAEARLRDVRANDRPDSPRIALAERAVRHWEAEKKRRMAEHQRLLAIDVPNPVDCGRPSTTTGTTPSPVTTPPPVTDAPAAAPPPLPLPLPPGVNRPQLERFNIPGLPLEFCSEKQKQDFLVDVYHPAADTASKNALKTSAYRARLSQLILEATQRGDAQAVAALKAEYDAFKPFADETDAVAQRMYRMRAEILAIPVVDCSNPDRPKADTPPAEPAGESLEEIIIQAGPIRGDGTQPPPTSPKPPPTSPRPPVDTPKPPSDSSDLAEIIVQGERIRGDETGDQPTPATTGPKTPAPNLSQPQFERVREVTPPAKFCSEFERNDFLNNIYNPAVASALNNARVAQAHQAKLNALFTEHMKANSEHWAAVRAERDAYEAIAKEATAEAEALRQLYAKIMAVPVVPCETKPDTAPPPASPPGDGQTGARPASDGPVFKDFEALPWRDQFCSRAEAEAYLARTEAMLAAVRDERDRLESYVGAVISFGPLPASSPMADRDLSKADSQTFELVAGISTGGSVQGSAADRAAVGRVFAVLGVEGVARLRAYDKLINQLENQKRILQELLAKGEFTAADCPEPSDDATTAEPKKPCPPKKGRDPITVGPNSKVGSGAQLRSKIGGMATGAVLGALGVGGGGGGGSEPWLWVCKIKDSEYTMFNDPVTGVSLRVGAKRAKGGKVIIFSEIAKSPDKGTFQTAFLERPSTGETMAPTDIGPCDLWGEWKLTVSWTRTTYVNGQMTSQESGGWSEGGFFKIPGVLSPTAAPDGFWKQMGFSSAQMGAREMGMIFDVPPGGGPLTFVIHVTRPKGDPVTTVPFVLTMTEGPGGGFTFTKAEDPPCPAEDLALAGPGGATTTAPPAGNPGPTGSPGDDDEDPGDSDDRPSGPTPEEAYAVQRAESGAQELVTAWRTSDAELLTLIRDQKDCDPTIRDRLLARFKERERMLEEGGGEIFDVAIRRAFELDGPRMNELKDLLGENACPTTTTTAPPTTSTTPPVSGVGTPATTGGGTPAPTGGATPSGPATSTPTPPTTGMGSLPRPNTNPDQELHTSDLNRLVTGLNDIRARELADRKALDAARCKGPEAWEAVRVKYLKARRSWLDILQRVSPIGPDAGAIQDAVNGEIIRVTEEILEVEGQTPPPAPKTCPPGEDTDVDSILDEIDEVFVPA